MVNHSVLEKAISRLSLNYNSHRDKQAQEELKSFWSSYFQDYGDKDFVEACQRILDDPDIKRFPVAGQIKVRLPMRQRAEVQNCRYCHNGIRIITEIIPTELDKHFFMSNRGGQRTFTCSCHAGDSYRKDLATCELGMCPAYDIALAECHATDYTPETVKCGRWKKALARLHKDLADFQYEQCEKKAEDCTNPKKAECKSPYCAATCRFKGINQVGEAKNEQM